MEPRSLPEIILASSSPRRRDLLESIGIPFRVFVPEVDESVQEGEAPNHYAVRTAGAKAVWVAEHLGLTGRGEAAWLVAADTVVAIGDCILGKPTDAEDAQSMLRRLSGRWHEVMTGVCVVGIDAGGQEKTRSLLVSTAVEMKELSETEIAHYVATGEPMDKAGSYAVQGRAGYIVRSVKGSYTNVVGLPLTELVELLVRDFGYPEL